jgi:hypothetical protein
VQRHDAIFVLSEDDVVPRRASLTPNARLPKRSAEALRPAVSGVGAKLARAVRRWRPWAIAAVLLYLLPLHALLLWRRIADLSLFETGVALRWGAAAALLVGAGLLHRAGISLWSGRRALTFWVLVLLLHASAAVPLVEEAALDLLASLPAEAFVLTAPLSLVLVASWLVLLALRAASERSRTRRRRWCEAPHSSALLLRGFHAPLFSRPPPSRFQS